MSLDLQFKIKNNQKYLYFLHHNSYWYKYLNRDDGYFKDFVSEVKSAYKLRPLDKIEHAIDTFDMVQTIFNNFK